MCVQKEETEKITAQLFLFNDLINTFNFLTFPY